MKGCKSFSGTVSGIVAAVLFSLFLFPSPVSAQEEEAGERYEVSGTVMDELGNPLAGAAVVIRGLPVSEGVITDLDGKFSIMAPPKSTLMVSYVGYREVRMPMGSRRKVVIEMSEDTEYLDDVVVVGYGTQKKSDLTGSIASVDARDIRNVPARTMAEALQGKVSGVMVSKNDGTPGSESDIVIRGVGSINGLNPLFVIDGVAVGSTADYNLSDIESIEVIKDASAAAIYGSRAAGGVILVTTKKGEEGSVYTTARYEAVWSMPTDEIEVVDPKTYMQMYNEALLTRNPNASPAYTLTKIERTGDPRFPSYVYPANDWYDILFKNFSVNHRAGLNVRGGSNVVQYYASVNYTFDQGIKIT